MVASLLIHSLAAAHREVRFAQEFGGKGEGEGEFAPTTSIAFDRQGGIYITDTDNFRIQKLDANGRFQFEIQTTAPEKFTFLHPTDIAVGKDGTIYVMDWLFVRISEPAPIYRGTENPKLFNYGPCVHRFDPSGNFIASYPIRDFSKRVKPLESAAPGLDVEGNYALVIPQGDTQRSLLLTVDEGGNIYVFDEGDIYKLAPDGQPVATFTTSQPSAGQLIKAADMTADRQGNLYIADERAHRVLKYGPNGQFLLAFGEYGDRAGQFISPFHLIALDDGTLLVADEAKYKKDYISDLPRRQYAPFQFGAFPYRVFRTRLRRVQRFYANSEYAEKILIRFERENEERAHLKLKAIDYDGNLYFVNTDTLKLSQFVLTSPLNTSAFQTEVKLRYTLDVEDVEIDNQDDLDADFGTKADFDERLILHEVDATARVTYDVNEDLRFALSNRLAYFRYSDKSFYRTRLFEDFRGAFNQDDESTQTFWDDRIQVEFTLIRNHNPYRYREAGAFAYFNIIRNDFINDALHPSNLRFFDFRARISDWGAGMHYDLSKAFQLQFMVIHFFGYNTYIYDDELGIRYATGFQQADSTIAVLTIDGVF